MYRKVKIAWMHDCMIWESLREHAIEIINSKRKRRTESYVNTKICYICKEIWREIW